MRLSFHFSFIHLFVAFGTTVQAVYDTVCREAIHDHKKFMIFVIIYCIYGES